MADLPNVPPWLAVDRSWLTEQPGLAHWPATASRIADTLRGWLAKSVAELGVASPGPAALERLWACWSHHWRTAIESGGGPVDGWDVAAQIEAGRGFRRRGNLGGNVVRDVVLATAMLQKDNEAVRRFERDHKDAIVRQVTAVRRFVGEDPGWWNDLLADLVGVQRAGRDGRLKSYSGRSGLGAWTVTVAVRFLADRANPRARMVEIDDATPDPITGQSGAIRLAIATDCMELLTGRIRAALQTLRARERLALRLAVVDGLQGQQIAAVFRINPGNVSRLLQGARDALWEHMTADGTNAEAMRECFDALVEGGAEKNLADCLRTALEALTCEREP